MRKDVQTNLKFVDLLNEWDPFQLNNGSYETEIADVVQAVYECNEPLKLARKIQSIYEFSFEKIIPIENCLEVAEELLVIKTNDACPI